MHWIVIAIFKLLLESCFILYHFCHRNQFRVRMSLATSNDYKDQR